MNSEQPDGWYGLDDLPKSDPELYKQERDKIMASHVLATLRQASGQSLQDVANSRGTTKAAVHQLENRPLGKIQLGNLLSYFQAVGYDVDEEWAARTLAEGLPARTLIGSDT